MSYDVKDYPPYLDYPKPRKNQTNADCIRAMTDEELATLFTKVMAGNSWAQLDSIWQEKGMEENQRYFTRLNWLVWLKKEVSDGT